MKNSKLKAHNTLVKLNIAGFIIFICMLFFSPLANAQVVLKVPFTPQAPFGNWAEPYQNFCEEANVVMAAHFVWNYPLSRELADTEMNIIKNYEVALFGYYQDTSARETASILKNLYGLMHVATKEVRNVAEIKTELALGNIVLAPVFGKMFYNPHFVSPGPFYHMVLIKGFDDAAELFITNEPGTRYGNGYTYQQSVLFHAIHDWNNGDVLRGKKIVIVVGR